MGSLADRLCELHITMFGSAMMSYRFYCLGSARILLIDYNCCTEMEYDHIDCCNITNITHTLFTEFYSVDYYTQHQHSFKEKEQHKVDNSNIHTT